MAISLDQLLYGVRMVESGGNYGVVNSIGAVGAYQVMKANIPSWTKKALGYSMTWQQFRDSRAAQDKVARVILGGYYSKYGAEGAASMWFSGQPNPNSKASDGGNTVRQYVNKVIGASGGGSISSGGGSVSAGTTATVAKLDSNELMEMYGLSNGLIGSSKELAGLFSQAVANTWSPARFQAALKNSKWWATQSDSLRKYITTKLTDPATWKQTNSAVGAAVRAMAVQVGVDPALLVKNGHWTTLFSDLVYKKQALGWTDARLKDYLGARVTVHGGAMWGEAGEAFDKLHTVAYLNGMQYSADWFKNQATSIVRGASTQETAEATIRNQAAAKYSAYAEQIKAGQNVMDLASPYIKSLSSLLELPETGVDLNNKYIAKAMTTKPATGASAGSQMPLWQFENEVRADPLWRKTDNARESMMTVARSVAKDFGLAW